MDFYEDHTGDSALQGYEGSALQKKKRKREAKEHRSANRRQQQIIKKSFNDLMHPRNSYKVKPHDFKVLAKKYPSFQQYVTENKYGNPTIDWKDPYAVRELTYVLLKDDYNIQLDIPIDQLCPTVPNRANYILWLSDLLKESSDLPTPIRGLDIGTGASCIYPLLGVAIMDWLFVATDIDDVSLSYAQKNIERNKLEHKIELRDAKSKADHDEEQKMQEGGDDEEKEEKEEAEEKEEKEKEEEGVKKKKKDNVLLGVVKEDERFAFCMCNPPFFSDIGQAAQNPKTVCTGTTGEMVTEGGELAFVKRIIADSLLLTDKIRWYTTMLGRKADVNAVLRILAEFNIVNVRTTTFYQGKTTRWGVGWSFSQDGLQELVKAQRAKRRRNVNELSFSVPTTNPGRIMTDLKETLDSLEIPYEQDPANAFLLHCTLLYCKWRDEEEEQKQQAQREKEDSEREARDLKQLVDLQNYLQQYTAVQEALEADAENEELLTAKAELGEVIELMNAAVQNNEESNTKMKEQREAEEENKELDLARKQRERRRMKEEGESLVIFDVVVYQAQSQSYMVEFTVKEGAEQLLIELFDYVKPRVTS